MNTRDVPLSFLFLEDVPAERAPSSKSDIPALAEDIAAQGLLNHLLVHEIDEECYIVVSGRRRFHALKLLETQGRPKGLVPIKILPGETIEEARASAVVDAVFSRKLSTYETASGLSLMPGTPNEIAKLTGFSAVWVSQLLTAWHGSTPELKEAWRESLFPRTTIFAVANRSPEDQRQFLKGIVTLAPVTDGPDGLTAKQEGRRGPQRGKRRRPSIATMRAMLHRLLPRPPQNDYETGLLDLLRYCVEGTAPSDPRWDAYTSRQVRQVDTRPRAAVKSAGVGSPDGDSSRSDRGGAQGRPQQAS